MGMCKDSEEKKVLSALYLVIRTCPPYKFQQQKNQTTKQLEMQSTKEVVQSFEYKKVSVTFCIFLK